MNGFVPEEIHIHHYLHLLGMSILYYDYFLTFPEEYARIWKYPKTTSSYLFFLNRYLAVISSFAVNWGNFSTFTSDCRRYAFFRQLLLVACQLVVCVLLFLRTYALYGRSWKIACLIPAVGLALLGISIWSIIGQHQDVELRGGCHIAAEHFTGIRLAVAWESIFTFDLMIFSLTLYKTWKAAVQERIRSGRQNIFTVLLRDGLLYFVIMAVVNCANALTFYFLKPLLKGCLSTFASCISTAMMSRLMLNLHKSAATRAREQSLVTTDTTTALSTNFLFTSEMHTGDGTSRPTFVWTREDVDEGQWLGHDSYELSSTTTCGVAR